MPQSCRSKDCWAPIPNRKSCRALPRLASHIEPRATRFSPSQQFWRHLGSWGFPKRWRPIMKPPTHKKRSLHKLESVGSPPKKKAWNLEHSFFIVSRMIFTDVPICLIFYSSDMSKVRSLRSILSHSAKGLWGQVCIGHVCSQLHPQLNMPRRACLWRHTTCLVIDQIADMFGPLGSNLGWATLRPLKLLGGGCHHQSAKNWFR